MGAQTLWDMGIKNNTQIILQQGKKSASSVYLMYSAKNMPKTCFGIEYIHRETTKIYTVLSHWNSMHNTYVSMIVIYSQNVALNINH